MELTQSYLKSILHYDADTGIFTWIQSRTNSIKVGSVAGCIDNKGYRRISIYGVRYQAHRLAFLYVKGRFPPRLMDHINRIRDDNRWANLRHVTVPENALNRSVHSSNTSKVGGVHFLKSDKLWRARIGIGHQRLSLGVFSHFFDAVCARKSAENKYWIPN